jgi:hypothetical protein
LVLPAYEQMVKASHAFNLLDARHAVSVTERQRFILRVRTLARAVAEAYRESREALGFPLLKNSAAERSRLMSAPRSPIRAGHRRTAAAHLLSLVDRARGRAAQGLDTAGIPHGKAPCFATPRRLAVRIESCRAAAGP